MSWSVGGNGGAMREPAQRLNPMMMRSRRAALEAIGIDPPSEDDSQFFTCRVGNFSRAQTDCFVFCFSDRAAQEKLGYWEESYAIPCIVR